MRRALVLLLMALPLYAERVRVIVAVAEPRIERGILRSDGISALRTATKVEVWGDGPAFAAEIDRDDLEELRRDPRVLAVALDEGGGGGLAQSVPLIGADAVHLQGIDGRGTTVAVLDSGIDASHPDFAGRLAGEACFCDNMDGSGCCPGGLVTRVGEGAAADDHGHGTHVAGIARAVAPGARIVAVKVLDSNNRFRSFTQIYRALEWVDENLPDVRVINMSLGSDALLTPEECDGFAVALGLQPVISRLRARGVLIAASSGNNGDFTAMWVPACMDQVVGVGSTYDSVGGTRTTADEVAPFTNSSDSLDVLAPGVSITSSARGGGRVTLSGTSMAAPHVAGLIALMIQAGGRAFPANAIVSILKSTGKPVLDPRNGRTFPRIDALTAIASTPRAPQKPRRRVVRH